MKVLFSSKAGMVLASLYVLVILVAALESCGNKPEPMEGFGFLILTAPWSFLLGILLSNLGVITLEDADSFLFLLVAFGGAINIALLLVAGHFLTRLFEYLSKLKP
jgi:hypothetical protein